ncbi:hypothetical protein ACH5RR_008699 [Cinchona calisaya]|uniref:RNase H type-1 domain-containing protein n=1 Tax=Cinchona calisaya TaxID=153742 RepID=A0ABD3ACD3_9GENT
MVWNIPFHWLTKEMGLKIGQRFNRVFDVKLPPSGSKEGKYMKILVELDIKQSLLQRIIVKTRGRPKWLQFREDRKLSIDVKEAEAVRLALIKAAEKGWKDILIEMGNQQLVDKFIKRKIGFSTMAGILEHMNVLRNLFYSCSFNFWRQDNRNFCNSIASFATKLKKEIEWEEFFPIWAANASKNY